MRKHFYGESKLLEELKNRLGRLERGQKPIFVKPLRIFEAGWSLASTFEPAQQEKVPLLGESEIQALVRGELNRLFGSSGMYAEIKKYLKIIVI
ncbi:MAG: hypothetical protein LUQ47_00740 [Methanotrichaceae archaeon]|nr:hypothetical protein [Methanotrichaceae archaeon]